MRIRMKGKAFNFFLVLIISLLAVSCSTSAKMENSLPDTEVAIDYYFRGSSHTMYGKDAEISLICLSDGTFFIDAKAFGNVTTLDEGSYTCAEGSQFTFNGKYSGTFASCIEGQSILVPYVLEFSRLGDITAELELLSSESNPEVYKDIPEKIFQTTEKIEVNAVSSGPAAGAPKQSVEGREYLEYMFSSTYPMSQMGEANVRVFMFFNGEYEFFINLKGFMMHTISKGTWKFNPKSDSFTLTDSSNGTVYQGVKTDYGYGFAFDFRGQWIEMKLVPDGKKAISSLNKGPAKPDVIDYDDIDESATPKFVDEEPTQRILLEAQGWTIPSAPGNPVSQDGFYILFYEDGGLSYYMKMRGTESSIGSWTFSEGRVGISVGGTDVDVKLDNGEYSFVIPIEVSSGYLINRQYHVAQDVLESGLSGELCVSTVFTDAIRDRYSKYSDEQWNNLWAEADMQEVTRGYEAVERSSELDSIFDLQLDRENLVPVEAKGSVLRVGYQTYPYDYYFKNNIPEAEWKTIYKPSYVYLPAGYDESNDYNIVYLLHGAGGSEKDWFSMNLDGSRSQVGEGDFICLVDNLIANGLMEPTIFVALSIKADLSGLDASIQEAYDDSNEEFSLTYEFERDIIPVYETLFSTHAKSVDHDSLVSTRSHRAIGGLSRGSYITWIAMRENLEIVSYYAPVANGCERTGVDENIASAHVYAKYMVDRYGDLGPDFIMATSGRKDGTYAYEYGTVDVLMEEWPAMKYGENISCFHSPNGTHTAKYFILGIYNAMKVFFSK